MKTLKFSSPLPDLILSWEKTTTWRINDDKDFQSWDIISFLGQLDYREFAQAKIYSTKITTFWELVEEDWDWHEKFKTNQEMLATYSNYYNMDVTDSTQLKIIKFKLI